MARIHNGKFFFFQLHLVSQRCVVFSDRFLQVQCIGVNTVEKRVVCITCAALYFDMLHQFGVMFSKSYGSFIFSVTVFF